MSLRSAARAWADVSRRLPVYGLLVSPLVIVFVLGVANARSVGAESALAVLNARETGVVLRVITVSAAVGALSSVLSCLGGYALAVRWLFSQRPLEMRALFAVVCAPALLGDGGRVLVARAVQEITHVGPGMPWHDMVRIALLVAWNVWAFAPLCALVLLDRATSPVARAKVDWLVQRGASPREVSRLALAPELSDVLLLLSLLVVGATAANDAFPKMLFRADTYALRATFSDWFVQFRNNNSATNYAAAHAASTMLGVAFWALLLAAGAGASWLVRTIGPVVSPSRVKTSGRALPAVLGVLYATPLIAPHLAWVLVRSGESRANTAEFAVMLVIAALMGLAITAISIVVASVARLGTSPSSRSLNASRHMLFAVLAARLFPVAVVGDALDYVGRHLMPTAGGRIVGAGFLFTVVASPLLVAFAVVVLSHVPSANIELLRQRGASASERFSFCLLPTLRHTFIALVAFAIWLVWNSPEVLSYLGVNLTPPAKVLSEAIASGRAGDRAQATLYYSVTLALAVFLVHLWRAPNHSVDPLIARPWNSR